MHANCPYLEADDALSIYRDFEAFEQAVQRVPDLNDTVALDGWDLLGRACEIGHFPGALLLISKGANPSRGCALEIAANDRSLPMLRLLLCYGANPNYREIVSPLFLACKDGQTGAARILLEFGADPNLCCGYLDEMPPLMIALLNRRTPCLSILLNGGANPNIRWRCLPDLDAMPLVLEQGTTLFCDGGETMHERIPCENTCTPLMLAAATGNIEAVTLLLGHGANPGIADSYGLIPADYLALINCEQMRQVIADLLTRVFHI